MGGPEESPGSGGGQPRAIREGRPLCCPSRQLQAAVGVRLRCFTPGRVSVEHCRRSPRRRQPPACLSFAAPQAVHDDLVAAVSLAAYDHMGDYDGTASPQVYGTQPAASAQSATGACRRVGTLIRSGPPLRGGQTRGGDWRSVQVRFEFVNPEHLALNSGSGFSTAACGDPVESVLPGRFRPSRLVENPARGARAAASGTTPSKTANAPSDASSARTAIGCSGRGRPGVLG